MGSAKRNWAMAVLAIMLIAGSAIADDEKNPVTLDNFSIGWDGCYRPMDWTPIELHFSNKLKKVWGGKLLLTVQQDELTTMTIRRPDTTMLPEAPLRLQLVGKVAYGAEKCTIVLSDDSFISRFREMRELRDTSSGTRALTALNEPDILIGVLGRPAFGLSLLGNNTAPQSGGSDAKVYVRQKSISQAAVDWTAYASLDLLVLYDLDWDQLTPLQDQAIIDWVGNGGKCLMVLGSHPLPAEHPLGRLLPFRVDKSQDVRLAGGVTNSWGCQVGREKLKNEIPMWLLPAKPGPGWEVQPVATAGDGARASIPLLAGGPVGFGRVGVLACDPSVLGGQQGDNLSRFWVDRLAPMMPGREIKLGGNRDNSSDNYYGRHQIGASAQGSNAVMEHLFSIPEMRPLSIWVVIGLLTALAVLIGPVDYFILKRLDKLPLTWVTSAGWIVLFSVVAYFGVEALRAGSTQVRAVSVMDAVASPAGPEKTVGWVTTYSGIFAPSSDNYRLKDRGGTALAGNQWWSSMVPTEGEYLSAWNQRGASREIFCVQANGGNVPESVPINIWSMQCLLRESPSGPTPLWAEVSRTGGHWRAKVYNRSSSPIRSGAVLVAEKQGLPFGAIPPGGSVEVSGAPIADRSDEQSVPPLHGFSGRADQAVNAQACIQRTRAISQYLAHGAAVVQARFEENPTAFMLAEKKGDYNHIQFARLVVMPGD